MAKKYPVLYTILAGTYPLHKGRPAFAVMKYAAHAALSRVGNSRRILGGPTAAVSMAPPRGERFVGTA